MHMRKAAVVGALLLALFFAASTGALGATDTVTLHTEGPTGPEVTVADDGTTIYINATDGVTTGGSITVDVWDGSSITTLPVKDNGAQADETANDGWYAGFFTIYNDTVPGVPGAKIQLDHLDIATVFVDLDGDTNNGSDSVQANYQSFNVTWLGVVESSPYIYAETSTDTLYYSNDQAMSENITFQFTDTKHPSNKGRADGETAFGNTPSDTDYSDDHWDLNYTVDQGEITDGTLTFEIRDDDGHLVYHNITVVLDNTAPVVDNMATVGSPDYAGPSYDWWAPSNLGAGLNVTWDITESGSGVFNGTMDWNSTSDVDDQLGVNVGTGEWYLVTGLTDDFSGYINITVTVYDKAGNIGNGSMELALDSSAPALTIMEVVESSANIHFNDTSDTLYYSNDQAMTDHTLHFRITDDEAYSGRRNASGDNAFGNTPSDNDYTKGYWQLTYYLSTGETATSPITLYVMDNVRNLATYTITTVLDNEAPDIDGWFTESSPYLYKADNVTHHSLLFGKGMPGTVYATFMGNISDDTEMAQLQLSNEAVASNPSTPVSLNGTTGTWNIQYGFDGSSTSDGQIEVTLLDIVGNSDSVTFPYFEDRFAPRITLVSYSEGGAIEDDNAALDNSSSPWTVNLSSGIVDGESGMWNVTGSADGSWTTVTEASAPTDRWFIDDEMFNTTGWHTMRWVANDNVNNSRVYETSLYRATENISDHAVQQISSETEIVEIETANPYNATINVVTGNEIWTAVARYGSNPAVPDSNMNQTKFHFVQLDVNDTSLMTRAEVDIYFTATELSSLNVSTDDIRGLGYWDGSQWALIPGTTVTIAPQWLGAVMYEGHVSATIYDTYPMAILAFRYKVEIIDALSDSEATLFHERTIEVNYTRTLSVVVENQGSGADDYWLNVSGPNDWWISWSWGLEVRKMFINIFPGESRTFDLKMRIPSLATNVSAGGSGIGRTYDVLVEIVSVSDPGGPGSLTYDNLSISAMIPRTDLGITGSSSPTEAIAGQYVTVLASVTNYGNWTTVSMVVRFYEDAMTPGNLVKQYLVQSFEVPPLESISANYSAFINGSGSKTFFVEVNYTGNEYDGHEDNATLFIVFRDTSVQKASSFALGRLPMAVMMATVVIITFSREVKARGRRWR